MPFAVNFSATNCHGEFKPALGCLYLGPVNQMNRQDGLLLKKPLKTALVTGGAKRIGKADIVIYNDATIAELEQAAKRLIHYLEKKQQ